MKKYLVLIFFFIASFAAQAQTLDEQYHQMKDGTETFKSYKVIKETMLDAFWNSVLDTLSDVRQNVSEAKRLIDAQEKELAELKSIITEKDQQLQEKEYAGSHITVLGIDWSKDSYIIFNFVLIGILLIAMGVLMFKFKDNNKIAKKKSHDYNRLETEFEEYKRNALEKQMRLRRDLQTAQNKLEEIRST